MLHVIECFERHRRIALIMLGTVSGLLSPLAAFTVPGGWLFAPGFLYGLLVVWPGSWQQDPRPLHAIRVIGMSTIGYVFALSVFVFSGAMLWDIWGFALASAVGATVTHRRYFSSEKPRFSQTFLACIAWGAAAGMLFPLVTMLSLENNFVSAAITVPISLAIWQGGMAAVISFERVGELNRSGTDDSADD